jgi:hypothetical protein
VYVPVVAVEEELVAPPAEDVEPDVELAVVEEVVPAPVVAAAVAGAPAAGGSQKT